MLEALVIAGIVAAPLGSAALFRPARRVAVYVPTVCGVAPWG